MARPTVRLNILVAEDDPASRTLIAATLEKLGHGYVIAHNGVEALSRLAATSFDLVLMDTHMPEMTGVTATVLIRQSPDARMARIPVIAVTAHATKNDKENYLSSGFSDYITKPVDPRRLSDILFAALRPIRVSKPLAHCP